MAISHDIISEVVSDLGAPEGLPSSASVVGNGDSVTVTNSANNKTSIGSAIVANGQVAQVALPATAAIITSAQALTGVAPTGTYTSTVTFTVANGVITAIALS